MPAAMSSTTLRLADPRNLIVAMLDGIGAENFPHRASMQAMPGFSDKLSDEEAATLANYLRVTWGGQKADVTPAAVRARRQSMIPKSGYRFSEKIMLQQ
jgi:mono/diheme cytochrome c family protein